MTAMILLASRAAQDLIRSGGAGGTLTTRTSWVDQAAAVIAVGNSSRQTLPCPLDTRHFLAVAENAANGRWFRADPHLHRVWWELALRENTMVPRDAISGLVETSFPTTTHPYWMITYAPGSSPQPEMLAWQMHPDGASPIDLEVEPAQRGIATLAPGWPVQAVQDAHVLLIGVGSIGSSTAHTLADAGIGDLTLLDPDRLRWHNLVRHQAHPRHIGRHKVSALRQDLLETRTDTRIRALPTDAIHDADRVRALLRDSDIAICAADGVAVRRVISHLARRAIRPAVLACVLDDGAIGEVLRLRPWPDHGCLTCRREDLVTRGAVNPEPHLDAGYGTGNGHRPMTAVGADLRLVGDLAARITISTLLERRGHRGHQLPGEHAILSLRPPRDLAAPFDAEHPLELRWSPAPEPRPNCPTCST